MTTSASPEDLLCTADQRSLSDPPGRRRPAPPIEFVLEPPAYAWLLAEQEQLAPPLRETLQHVKPEDGGYRFTMSRELALELASMFVDEGRRQGGIAALDDMWLVAVTTIGLEMWMWSPRPR